MLHFGKAKRSTHMEDDKRIKAFNHFPDFMCCCYLTDEKSEMKAPIMMSYLHSAP
uniref:Uncharacterized protein n=1 Tax=Peronospora matthiolae TaxID=2874970 RepID=A0AAV1T7Y6_9STRA